ncbi:MAG: DUF4080 domain-containing protein [Gammaproteobacteria bacterium]|nr:DUF4080 domain-containing protein [Gammaproteobacteria bacterium]
MQVESISGTDAHPIVLATLNARYIHSAFGLRYLHANLAELQERCVIEEFTIESRPEDIVERLLAHRPQIIGLGVYIWNVVQTEQVVALLKAVAPEIKIVLGGPEVSYEHESQHVVQLADYVITGWGDLSFRDLVRDLLTGTIPQQKIVAGLQPRLAQICMPYHLYTDDDIHNRVLYVEASRGCPFKCEFCLSALDKTAWPFDLTEFLQQMDDLYMRGARHFKFVDRTFNLNIKNSLRILDFFLQRMDSELFLHFEVIPDHLPDALKEKICKFPVGSLQFEIGIQTFNPEVQARISRRQDNQKAQQNIRWICEHSQAHVHADLIFGLPGESLQSFSRSFNQLYALAPHEIQVGILKRLKGSPIVRHTQEHRLVFNPNPPFAIVSSDSADYRSVQEINRFARYWDLLANSGRFKNSLPLLLGEDPFGNFQKIARALFMRTGQTHKISLLRLYDLLFDIAVESFQIDGSHFSELIGKDHQQSGLKSTPKCLRPAPSSVGEKANSRRNNTRHKTRQARH